MYFTITSIFLLLGYVQSARILCVFPTSFGSNQIVYQTFWEELAKIGHDVTVLTPNPFRNKALPNLSVIDWSTSLWHRQNYMNVINKQSKGIKNFYDIWRFVEDTYDEQLSNPEVQRIINDKNERFDLVITEWVYPTMVAFSERFQCPLIGISTFPSSLLSLDTFEQPLLSISLPDFLFANSKDLNLFHELLNALFAKLYRIFYRVVVIPSCDSIVAKHFGANMRSLYDIERDVSAIFVNTNGAVNRVKTKAPTVVNVNGLHINPNQTLPKDLQIYLDESPEGVIYVNHELNFRTSSLSEHKIKLIMDSFSELPYKFLWKRNSDAFLDKPSNVKLSKLISQQAVLAHPNVIGFITDEKMQSLEEAIYYQTPIIAMPINRDKYGDINLVVSNGLGLVIDYETVAKDSLTNAVLEVVKNPKYKESIKEMSVFIKDQPKKSLDLAVWWTEYIISNKGTKHMKSPLPDIPWYQYYLLDVIAMFSGTLYTISFVFKKCIRFIVSLCRLPRFILSPFKIINRILGLEYDLFGVIAMLLGIIYRIRWVVNKLLRFVLRLCKLPLKILRPCKIIRTILGLRKSRYSSKKIISRDEKDGNLKEN